MAVFEININEKISNVIIGEPVNRGDLLYLHSNAKWYKANAVTKSRSTTELMLALEDGNTDDQIDLLHYGYFDYGDARIDPKEKYYVSASDGQITKTVYDEEGYVIRYIGTGFTNNVLLFNPDQTYISDNNTKINEVTIAGTGGGGSGVFQNNIIVSLGGGKTVGKYGNGDEIPSAGMTYEEFANDIAKETIDPTFTPFSFTGNAGNSVEVGTNAKTISLSFVRGNIVGDIDNGVWNPSLIQGRRLGGATKFWIDGIDNGLSTTKNISKLTTLGPNSVPIKVDYSEGDQPKDSTGADFGIKESAGSLNGTATWTGFYYRTAIAGNNAPTATDIRNNPTARRNSGGVINLPTGTTAKRFDVFVPQGSTLTSAIDVDNMNLNITSDFISQADFSGLDANGEVVIYKHYVKIIENPYTSSTNFAIEVT